jgi:Flp pilus assembly pilin Flp
MMQALYVRAINSIAAARTKVVDRDDRGAVSVEQAIMIGVVATAAVLVGTALVALVTRKVGEWSGI